MLKGRRLLINLAVDKDTASTLKRKEDATATGRDRRNLYLKTEGRVEDNWEQLPEGDKLKRQTAWSDKTTKLRSPLFFVNPTRLSIRNLAKHVDEKMLKQLIVDATLTGLKRKLVTEQDQIEHWRASGDMTTRDILDKIQKSKEDIIPPLETINIKKYIPSVFISRDFGSTKSDKAASRGFGFAEFEHHVHALACLRQLNNNAMYSEQFTTGGKVVAEKMGKRLKKKKTPKKRQAPDGENPNDETFIPRLIVEFTVENKVKAKQQAEHRAAQQANKLKQRIDHNSKKEGDEEEDAKLTKTKRKSRGALQREKKRQKRAEAQAKTADSSKDKKEEREALKIAKEKAETKDEQPRKKDKLKKPPKKRKVDTEEKNFETLLESYKQKLPALVDDAEANSKKRASGGEKTKSGKRWFD